jgi:dienelactone hydrolase
MFRVYDFGLIRSVLINRMQKPSIPVVMLAVTAILATAIAAPATVTPQSVEIPQDNATLKAVLFKPEGAGPFPAVVGLHGCAGLTHGHATVASQYRDWAEHLVAAGFVVLYPDSYASRGLGSQCTVRRRPVRTDRERVADAEAARRWLQTQSYVRPAHVTLLGWSTGAITVLWTVRRRASRPKDDTPDFRSAVALYPGCQRLDNTAWSARVPTLILIGAADDWASAQVCEHMVAGTRGRSARTSIVVYPGTYHEFDHPNRPLQMHTGYAYSTDGSGRVHTGTNQVARTDALKRIPEWLAR